MALFNKVHLFLPCVAIKDIVYLLEWDKAILLRCDENPRNCNIFNYLLEIHIIYVKVCFLGYYRLYVVEHHVQQNFREVGLLFADFEEQLFKRGKRTVEDGNSDGLFVQSDVSEG